MRKEIIFSILAILTVSSYGKTNGIEKINRARNSFERQERIREEREIQNILKKEIRREENVKTITIKNIGKDKYLIKEIKLLNAILLDEKYKNKLIEKYSNKKLGLGEIYTLVGELTNEYIKRGYTTTKVTIPLDQKIGEGKLILKVIPGKVEEILMEKMNKKEKKSLEFAFPSKKGDYLSLFQLEQGILNLNNSVYNNAKMKLIPGSELGKTIVYIENDKKFSGIGLSYNNQGQESTGKIKQNLSFRTGDLLFNDDFNISYEKNLDGNSQEKYNKSLVIDYTIPYKFWKFGISSSYSKYLTTVDGIVKPIKSSGETLLTSYKVEKVLKKIGRGKLNFQTSLNIKTKKDYINNKKIDVSSRSTTNLKNKLSYIGKFHGGSLYSDLTYTLGLEKLGATDDLNTLSSSPRSDYNKYNLNVRWVKPFNYKRQFFTYEFSLGGQYSEDRLFSQDKFSIGDDVSVRGYESGVSGENGYYLRNQLNYNLASLTINNRRNRINKIISKLNLFVGLDYGMIRDKENKGSSKYLRNEELVGLGTGLKYYGNNFNWGLSYFKGINAPDYVKKDGIFSFNISLNI